MKIFVSLISHFHGSLIKDLGVALSLSKSSMLEIIVRDNVGEESLRSYCEHYGLHYQLNQHPVGFGENNNRNFDFCLSELTMTDRDFFLVLNPDVLISSKGIEGVATEMNRHSSDIATCNLFLDSEKKVYDNSIRRFPGLLDFLCSYFSRSNPTVIDKSSLFSNQFVDWAAGSFLLFRSDLYKKLGGFDESFFMYCEDIDICRRASFLNSKGVLYVPSVHGVHLANQASRKFLSRHFFWHVRSVVLYLLKSSRL